MKVAEKTGARIDDVFREEGIEFGLDQKPNWGGLVYGKCQADGCPNNNRIGYYFGGFCKMCSKRTARTEFLLMSDPRVEWIQKNWIKDLSHLMSPAQWTAFYDKRERKEEFDPDLLI